MIQYRKNLWGIPLLLHGTYGSVFIRALPLPLLSTTLAIYLHYDPFSLPVGSGRPGIDNDPGYNPPAFRDTYPFAVSCTLTTETRPTCAAHRFISSLDTALHDPVCNLRIRLRIRCLDCIMLALCLRCGLPLAKLAVRIITLYYKFFQASSDQALTDLHVGLCGFHISTVLIL